MTSKRSPWYKQEQRDPAPFLCTYMGRKGKHGLPFRFIWNKSRAIATNVYLLLYPTEMLKRLLEHDAGLYSEVYKMLEEIDTIDIVGESRAYGGGLYKLEPKELAQVPVRHFDDLLGQF